MDVEKLHKINALIAEKVMGWRLEKFDGVMNYWFDNKKMIAADYDWCPSTDISDAWKVVEKLHDSGFYFTIKSPPRGKSDSYWVCIDDFYGEKYYTAHGVTAPLAICLAALKAVGVEVE